MEITNLISHKLSHILQTKWLFYPIIPIGNEDPYNDLLVPARSSLYLLHGRISAGNCQRHNTLPYNTVQDNEEMSGRLKKNKIARALNGKLINLCSPAHRNKSIHGEIGWER